MSNYKTLESIIKELLRNAPSTGTRERMKITSVDRTPEIEAALGNETPPSSNLSHKAQHKLKIIDNP